MRQVTAAENALLGRGQGYACRYRVWVKNAAGTYVDLTNLESESWAESVRIEESVDQPISTCEVTLVREKQRLSLAPRVLTSKLNSGGALLAVARRMYVEVGIAPAGGRPIAYNRIFEGYVYDIEWGGEDPKITLSCFDLGIALQDCYIESEASYASAAGVAVETVIQNIITASKTTGTYGQDAQTVTVYTPSGTSATPIAPSESPGYNIKPAYLQKKMPVFEAIDRLAKLNGWALRYWWDNGTGSGGQAFRLTFFDPNRSKTTPDLTLNVSDWIEIQGAHESLAGVRTRVRVTYQPTTNVIATSETDVAAAVTAYGRRFMEIVEEAGSQIDTSSEADAFRDRALDDLSYPKLELTVRRGYDPRVQLWDLVRFKATDDVVHFDEDQDCGVVALSHVFEKDGHQTVLTVMGDKTGGAAKKVTGFTIQTWGERAAGPGVGPDVAEDTEPSKHNAFVYLNTTQEIISGTGRSDVSFDAEAFDLGGNFDTSVSEWCYRVPIDGVYAFTGQATFDDLPNGKTCRIFIEVGGIEQPRVFMATNSSGGAADTAILHPTKVMSLVAGDEVRLTVGHDHSSSVYLLTGKTKTWFAAERLYNDRGQVK